MTDSNEDSYAGRWVARLHGRVVAQGGTPDQVRRAAQSRYKETPEVQYMPTQFPLIFPSILDEVRRVLPDWHPVYLVGGAIRDALLSQPVHDLDFVMQSDAVQTARRVANKLKADFYILDADRDTGRVIISASDGSRMLMDFAAFRGDDLHSDLRARDFTLNAIALDLEKNTLLDPMGGAVDLKEKRLRACSPSALSDDPVRILRGVRLAANYGFSIMPETRQLMRGAVSELGNISPERIRDELFRILEGMQPATCLRALDILGVFEYIMPELPMLKGVEQAPPHVHPVWEHVLSVVGYLDDILAALARNYDPETASNMLDGLLVLRIGRFRSQINTELSTPITADRSLRGLLILAALYHDVAKPMSKKVDENGQMHFRDHDQHGGEIIVDRARFLALANDEIQRLELIVRNHMRVHSLINRFIQEGVPPTRRAIYRFFRTTGSAGVDICLLSLADLRATYEETLPQDTWTAALEVVRMLLEAWFVNRNEQITPPPLLDGNDLMRELSLNPGRLIGDLLEAIREAQATGEVTTQAQALELARKCLENTGT